MLDFFFLSPVCLAHVTAELGVKGVNVDYDHDEAEPLIRSRRRADL